MALPQSCIIIIAMLRLHAYGFRPSHCCEQYLLSTLNFVFHVDEGPVLGCVFHVIEGTVQFSMFHVSEDPIQGCVLHVG
jgi:hypothetical protein